MRVDPAVWWLLQLLLPCRPFFGWASLAVYLGAVALWIWALVDCVRREFPGRNDKLVWVLVVVLGYWIGAIIYLVVGRPKGWLSGETRGLDGRRVE